MDFTMVRIIETKVPVMGWDAIGRIITPDDGRLPYWVGGEDLPADEDPERVWAVLATNHRGTVAVIDGKTNECRLAVVIDAEDDEEADQQYSALVTKLLNLEE